MCWIRYLVQCHCLSISVMMYRITKKKPYVWISTCKVFCVIVLRNNDVVKKNIAAQFALISKELLLLLFVEATSIFLRLPLMIDFYIQCFLLCFQGIEQDNY